MSSHYPLPRASQECWTKWYNHIVTCGALKNKTIIWVAQELPCRFKADQVKDIIGPHHVFILKLNEKFFYALVDSTESVYRLPKKYFTACFPGIQLSQVPENNRCRVRLSGRRMLELPYIPEPFLEQKKTKTGRKRRRGEAGITEIENRVREVQAPEWTVLGDERQSMSNKDGIMHLIRSVIAYSDKNENFTLFNEFENVTMEEIQNSDELRQKMKTIISFIYYYCRGELGFFQERPKIPISDLQSWFANTSS